MKNYLVIGASSGIAILFLSFAVLRGQTGPEAFYGQHLRITNSGMMVLGTWAIANISSGAYGWYKFEGQSKYFHQMNLFWNTVNLSIAGIALYSNRNADFAAWSQSEILSKQLRMQNLFLINAGLDVGYMGAGLLLNRIAHRYPKKEERLKGYGNSVILQGAFLFVFDLVMYGIVRNHRTGFIEQVSLVPVKDGMGFSLHIPF